MTQITYEKAMKHKSIIILKGDALKSLVADKKNKFRLDCIKENIPMSFTKVNTTIHRLFKDKIEYINFWDGIEIYRAVE